MRLDTPLAQLIADQIHESGALSFRDFVELALYHPEFGYYNRAQAAIGKGGDYYTSPHVSPLFGWTLGRAIEKLRWPITSPSAAPQKRKKQSEPLMIVEFGGGRGFLAKDVMEYFRHQNPEVFEGLQYRLVEQSPALRRQQQKLLELDPALKNRVQWISADELQPFHGVVLANEFVDALPFHRLVLAEEGFKEVFVDIVEDAFCEVLENISERRLQTPLKETANEVAKAGMSWAVGQRIELCPAALDWISSLAALLEGGEVFIFDYGDEARNLYTAERPSGTARAFYQHQVTDHFFEHLGAQDLTADVNFTALMKAARESGFDEIKLQTQAAFLEENEIFKVAEDRERRLQLSPREAQRTRRQILNLILPGMMGARFKVLILAWNTAPNPQIDI